MKNYDLIRELKSVKELLRDYKQSSDVIMTAKQASDYLGISIATLYKMTSLRTIPHYKPNGQLLYFRKSELDSFVLRNRIESKSEIEMR